MCEAALNTAYNQIVSSIAFTDYEKMMLSTKEFNNVTISKDATTGTAYATYPAAIVWTRGIQTVNTVKGTDSRFFPMTERSVRLLSGTYAEGQMIEYGYIPKRERVEFYNIKDADDDLIITSCSMELTIQFKEFASTDTILMPLGKDYEVIQLAYDILEQTPILDLKNDNS